MSFKGFAQKKPKPVQSQKGIFRKISPPQKGTQPSTLVSAGSL